MTDDEMEFLIEANRAADRKRLIAEGASILDMPYDDGTTPRERQSRAP